jgi:ribosomal-protein-alanine N-acetyltransferase
LLLVENPMRSGQKFSLKPPTLEQLPEIAELDRRCLGGIWSLDGYHRELNSPNSELIIITVPSDHEDNIGSKPEKIIGCGCFWAILEEAHITLLMIDLDYQEQGFGQLLLYTLLKIAATERELERATLEVRESNQAALSLYQKFGFQALGRRKGYYQQTGEDAIILWRGDLHKPEFRSELIHWQQMVSDRFI